ncbi:MAG: AAA family ATPase [Verrucomicrobia bacterium]|nr:AAA family ATPase [Verrucomicrobiota bacterium]
MEAQTLQFEFLQDRQELVSAEVNAYFRGKGWDDFPAASTGRQTVRDRVRRYADDLIQGVRRPLLLYGPPGTGKSYLAALVWQEIAAAVGDRREISDAANAGTADNFVWVNGAHIPKIAKSGNQENEDDLPRPYHLGSAYLGVIDDVDKCPAGSWAEALYWVINERIAMRNLPTILTMNLTPRAFVKKYGECGLPMFDRIKRTGGLIMRLDSEESDAA